jgi:hypothetical protein
MAALGAPAALIGLLVPIREAGRAAAAAVHGGADPGDGAAEMGLGGPAPHRGWR